MTTKPATSKLIPKKSTDFKSMKKKPKAIKEYGDKGYVPSTGKGVGY